MVVATNMKFSKEVGSPSYLVVCDGGNVRSAAIATTLKLDYGREAVAVGRLYMSKETMYLLANQFDRIILTQAHMLESIPSEFHWKVQIHDVGQDRWGISIAPELNVIANGVTENILAQEGQGNGN